ncbi:MAG: sugar kinase [Thermoprotei archaeon]
MERMDVVTLGEILVEIMRIKRDIPHNVIGEYFGPYPSGAPAIFADACARLGLHCGLIGVVGADDFGQLLLTRLEKDGVDISYVKIKRNYTTGTAFVMYNSSGARKFIFHLRHAAAGQLSPHHVNIDYISKARLLHVMGSTLAVNRRSYKACYRAMELAKKACITITFDPNLRPELLDARTIRELCKPFLDASDIIMLSQEEARTLTEIKNPIEAAKKLLKLGPNIVAIKMGDKGSIALTREKMIIGPAFEVNEIDPTGAGDVYDAAFIVGVLKGWPIEKTIKFANAAGAIKVTRLGPMEGPKSYKEVEDFMVEAKLKQIPDSIHFI